MVCPAPTLVGALLRRKPAARPGLCGRHAGIRSVVLQSLHGKRGGYGTVLVGGYQPAAIAVLRVQQPAHGILRCGRCCLIGCQGHQRPSGVYRVGRMAGGRAKTPIAVLQGEQLRQIARAGRSLLLGEHAVAGQVFRGGLGGLGDLPCQRGRHRVAPGGKRAGHFRLGLHRQGQRACLAGDAAVGSHLCRQPGFAVLKCLRPRRLHEQPQHRNAAHTGACLGIGKPAVNRVTQRCHRKAPPPDCGCCAVQVCWRRALCGLRPMCCTMYGRFAPLAGTRISMLMPPRAVISTAYMAASSSMSICLCVALK